MRSSTQLPEDPYNNPATQLAAIRPALDAIDREELPAPSCVALPPGLDRSVLRDLSFRVRTWNCLNAAGLFDGNDSVSVRDLLCLPGFGNLSLRDLLLVVSNYLNQLAQDTPPPTPQDPLPNTPRRRTFPICQI